MAYRRSDKMQVSQPPSPTEPPPGKPPGIKVSLKVLIICVIIVGLAVFLLMIFQYFPGYRVYRDIVDGVKDAKSVDMVITTTRSELESRDINPLQKEKDIEGRFKDMGAKEVDVKIEY